MLENIETITGIIFAVTATVLAILTYKRAKETFLQPVRSEVIKKQTELLIELYSLLGDENSVHEDIDYHEIVTINIFDSFITCGAIFNDEELLKKIMTEKKGTGLMFMGDDGRVDGIEKPGLFSEDESEDVQNCKKHYTSAKNGVYSISILLLTKKHDEFQAKILKMLNNPFLPIEIKTQLEKFMDEIRLNLKNSLKKAVEKAVNSSFSENRKTLPDTNAVFNIFNKSKLSHKMIVEKINAETRKYLKIDSMP